MVPDREPASPATTCGHCGKPVPDLEFCCRCGHRLADGVPARRGVGRRSRYFAANPNEPAAALRFTSTLFPQLPVHDMTAFRIALISGLALIVVLGIVGVFGVALAAAVALVPLLTLLYLVDVDVYEGQPLLVVGLTMLWGAVAGIGLGLVVSQLAVPVQQHGWGALGDGSVLVRVVAAPAAAVALAFAGPLLLLRHPRFNDVLDGVIFGAASAVTLWCFLVLVTAWPITQLGLTPQQDASAWTLRLIDLAVLAPIVAAGGVGWATAALWLRYRAPVGDRRVLGVLGAPPVALALAFAFAIAAAIAQQTLGALARSTTLAVLAALALLLLRRAIHRGLLEEADETEPGPPTVCASCGLETPTHTFCARCGVALRALPKRAPRAHTAGAS